MADCKHINKSGTCGLKGSYAYRNKCFTEDCCKCFDPQSNADHTRSMSDEELAELLCTADWCGSCDQTKEDGTCQAMELDGPLNKHCVAAALRWLQQPAEEG